MLIAQVALAFGVQPVPVYRPSPTPLRLPVAQLRQNPRPPMSIPIQFAHRLNYDKILVKKPFYPVISSNCDKSTVKAGC